MKKFLKLIISIGVSGLAGIIGSIFTTPAISNWYAGLAKPALNPPNWIFAPAWTVLYFLIGVSLYIVWENNWEVRNVFLEKKQRAWNRLSEKLWFGSRQKENIIAVFSVQLFLNVFWSVLFFGLKFPGLAFFEILALWISILWMIVNFYRVSKTAAYLLLPYIIWVSFAMYLNYAVWMLN